MSNRVCCFSGHRNIPEQDRKLIEEKTLAVIRELYSCGVRTFKAGGALGFDTLAALCVLELKKEFPDVKLVLELIAKTQAKSWAESERAIYDHVIERADDVRYASDIYTKSAIFARNRNLIEGSEFCVCYLTKKDGGTAYTVKFAAKNELDIINIANI